METEDFKKFWNKYAFYYTKLNLSPVHKRFVEDTCRAVAAREGEEVLDLGCGPGIIAKALSKSGARVTAVDYSETMLQYAKDNVTDTPLDSGRSPRFVHADAHEYLKSTPDDSFDVVLASLFLSYIEAADKRQSVLAEAFRVLRPGGRFIMSNPKPHPGFSRVFWKSGWTALRHIIYAIQLLRYAFRFNRFDRQGKFHFFSKRETVELLTGAGLALDPDTDIGTSLAETVYLIAARKPLQRRAKTAG